MKLRYYADTPNFDDHEQIIDLLYTISDKYGVTVEIERVKAFDRISMSVCRVLLRQSAQLHDPSKHRALTRAIISDQ